ncbi:MAG: MBL fold metallo-hydrolase [Deltaproteobacteria bacterium]|nr:MBL fold metallo-hydrolase [Deltaproteobacteria bacterium]
MSDTLDTLDAVYRAVRAASAHVVHDATPTPAVAVVLWRRRADAVVEVYVVRRAPALKFLGGFWSFPGGRIEAADQAAESAVIAAAVREALEELGISLPKAPSAYGHGGRWITPEVVPIRFDAHYLVHEYRGGEPDPSVSGGELDAGAWVSADELEQRWRSGEWLVPSPISRVVRVIGRLADDGVRLGDALDGEVEAENAEPRLWYPIDGVGFAPLRTPTLPPAQHTNSYFIGTGEVAVIDPATPYDDERAELDRIVRALADSGRTIAHVLLTHHHGDHVGAARYIADQLGVPVSAHPITAQLLGAGVVDRHLEDGQVVELAGEPRRRLRAVHTPGHAAGHLCFYEEETGSLVAGDMVAGIGTILIEPSEGDMAEYLRSLERIKELSPRFLLPAHGPLIADPMAKLDDYIRHRLWREQRVIEALRDSGGGSVDELVARAYRDVPPAVHPIAARSLLAHLRKLEDDGRAHRTGDTWSLQAT